MTSLSPGMKKIVFSLFSYTTYLNKLKYYNKATLITESDFVIQLYPYHNPRLNVLSNAE